MDEERTLILGMDICDGSLQLAYLDERGEMVSVSPFSNDVGKYRIPTAICTDPQYKEWYCGNDAMRMKGREGIAYFDDLVERAKADDGEPALGGLTPTALLTHFFRIVLTALREKTGGQIIKGLTVSIKKEDEAAMKQQIHRRYVESRTIQDLRRIGSKYCSDLCRMSLRTAPFEIRLKVAVKMIGKGVSGRSASLAKALFLRPEDLNRLV